MTVAIPVMAFILIAMIVFRHYDRKKQHLSVIQILIRAMYACVLWAYSVTASLDSGYTAYRKTIVCRLKHLADDLESERVLGQVVGSTDKTSSAVA